MPLSDVFELLLKECLCLLFDPILHLLPFLVTVSKLFLMEYNKLLKLS